jgi:hypothetical protein
MKNIVILVDGDTIMPKTFLLEDSPKSFSGREVKMKNCEVEECKQYMPRKGVGYGHQKYCDIHREIIRQQKRQEYSRIAWDNLLG